MKLSQEMYIPGGNNKEPFQRGQEIDISWAPLLGQAPIQPASILYIHIYIYIHRHTHSTPFIYAKCKGLELDKIILRKTRKKDSHFHISRHITDLQ